MKTKKWEKYQQQLKEEQERNITGSAQGLFKIGLYRIPQKSIQHILTYLYM